ncbi:DUF2971 domain-containing protein [Cognatishimia maritima]|uniref:DUF2971 domain-containing protein n=1 Tax=Cognatishimia maritima TaxID=870908 RepID=A0A1M5KHS5_9RHOB|nr:DUF2971 domain-containing protein [Cognatishimia maritima]SHG52265.1 Protein of unknown function [Cognatishimia maritima]
MTQNEETPKTLWHYTTANTLADILRSQCLLATDFRDLNDAKEIVHAIEIIEGFDKLRRHGPTNAFIFSENVEAAYKSIVEDFKTRFAYGQVICFSSKPDDLTMWRGYGRVVSGVPSDSVAIGFDVSDLRRLCGEGIKVEESLESNILKNKMLGFSGPHEVNYRGGSGPEIMNKLIDAERNETSPFELHNELVRKLSHFAMTHKDSGFEAENEFRIFTNQTANSSNIRMDNCELIGPEYRLKFQLSPSQNAISQDLNSPLAIREIITGPGANHDKIKRFCEAYFFTLTPSPPTVIKSKVPFR